MKNAASLVLALAAPLPSCWLACASVRARRYRPFFSPISFAVGISPPFFPRAQFPWKLDVIGGMKGNSLSEESQSSDSEVSFVFGT